MQHVSIYATVEQWPLLSPFRISGKAFEIIDVLFVRLEKDGRVGRGEAAGVYYRDDQPSSMLKQIEKNRARIAAGVSRDDLLTMELSSGARNALDCALWDLESKLLDSPVWQLANLRSPRPLVTTFGCGADTPENMVRVATSYATARAIKLKLTGEPVDGDRVMAVREARPDVWLSVDANQGFTRAFLERLMPVLLRSNVALIEQPFPVGQEALLDGFKSPIPIAADESAQVPADVDALIGRFDVVNIKLDKCGGLTQAISMVRRCRELGLHSMIGNNFGTSLGMAPAFVVGQECDLFVDLDGPVFLKEDRTPPILYEEGMMHCASNLWGYPV